ncbi:MAG TPA: branched-chain amino acid transaminase [Nitrolancea sp.]|nr:branched-chain amino acid transaminase [Nitrolancea sp.]
MAGFFPAGETPAFLWLDGRLVPWADATLHMTAMGASAHVAVFEGIRAYAAGRPDAALLVFRLREHLDRLLDSMTMMRMPLVYSAEELRDAILMLLRANDARGDTYIRPVAFYSGLAHPSFGDTLGAPPQVLIWHRPTGTQLLTERGKHIGVSSWTRLADNVMPPRIKSMSNYQNNRLAQLEARVNGYDDTVMLTAAGKVAESSGACVFLVRHGAVVTPAVTSGILESITRDAVIRLCREELGVPVVEREVDRTELYVADEVFCCGTAAEITPIWSVDRIPLRSNGTGPLTRRLDRLFFDVVRGHHPGYAAWRDGVGRRQGAGGSGAAGTA